MTKNLKFSKKLAPALNRSAQLAQLMALVASLVVVPLTGCGGSDKDSEVDNKTAPAPTPTPGPTPAPVPAAKAPTITTQPASVTVTELQPASFRVVASGDAPLAYQWKRNGTPIAGATSATLAITSALAADHGARYSAVVTNSTGAVTSNEAVFTQELPMFLMAGQSNMEGNAEASLFQTILPELASGASTETIKTNLAEQIRVWHLVPGANRGYGYSATVAAFEASEMVRLNAAGLVGADLTTPNTKVLCAWNSATVAPLVFSMLPTRCGGPGPELVFGQALSKAGYSSTSLIKVAHGGTNLYADWRSPLSGGTVSSRDLYAQLRSRIKSLKSAPTSVNPSCDKRTCRWSAFVWFQGENDVFDKDYGLAYEQNLKNLIADVRSDVGSPTLPVVIVQIGSWAQSISAGGKNVANAQTAVVNADKYARIINTADLSGYYHYDSAAQLIIGERVALAVKSLLAAESAPK